MANFYTIRRDRVTSALKSSRHFIEQITHNTPDLIFVLDLEEEEIVFVNKRVEDLFGVNEEVVYKMGPAIFKQFVHPDDLIKRAEHVEKCLQLEDDEILELELRLKLKDGNYNWFRIRDVVFKRNKNGKVIQTIGIGLDIQERKSAEEKALYRQKLMQSVLDISPNGVAILKAVRNGKDEIVDFEYLVANKEAERFHKRNDLVGKKLTEIMPGIQDTPIFQKNKDVVNYDEPYLIHQLWSMDGEVKLFRVSASKMDDGIILTRQEVQDKQITKGNVPFCLDERKMKKT